MKSNLGVIKEYKTWLAELKQKVRNAQLKAAVKVNSEMLLFYWDLGADIVAKQANAKWGEGFLVQLSKDLMSEFPEMRGFSERNLKYIRQWFLFYGKDKAIGQQPVAQLAKQPVSQSAGRVIAQDVLAQLTLIPWGHNIAIISKCRNIKEALFYVWNTLEHNWSRNVLVHQIESGLYKREGKSLTNFSFTLPKPQSDLAQQTLKNPYVFDFLSMRKDGDNPTIGLLLCKSRDKLVAEYALSDINKPIGVSEYKLTHKLPKELKSSLPTIEEIEKEFAKPQARRPVG